MLPSRDGNNPAPAPAHSWPPHSVHGQAALTDIAAPAITPAPRSRMSFPATAGQISKARHFLARFLADSPLATDAVICLSEVATNSITHSNSRRAGGRFTVTAVRYDDGRVRVEVEDQGGPWIERQQPEGRPNWGLLVVRHLVRVWGIKDEESARAVWFEVGPVPRSVQSAA